MKKKPASPKAIVPLLSRQWRSESTRDAQPDPPPNGSGSPTGSPTGGPPPDCENCRIRFYASEVTVAWFAGGAYSAPSNVNTSDGGWTPDYWTPRKSTNGANVTTGGLVTFGTQGETLTLSCNVKRCPNCTGAFTLNIVRIDLRYEGKDVTGKTTTVEVGNRIPLDAKITPTSLQPSGDKYAWEIPPKVLKDYKHDASADPIVPLTSGDLTKIALSFHWLDGGSRVCKVTTNVNGISLGAEATFDVSRPVASISGSVVNGYPKIISDSGTAWILSTAFVEFKRETFSNGTGEVCWTQVLDYTQVIEMLGGIVLRSYPPETNGLDDDFTFSGDPHKTFDAPSVDGNTNDFDWIQDHMDCVMFYMYRSVKPQSRWVPLRSIYWQVRANAYGTPGVAPVDYQIDASSYQYMSPSDSDATYPPDWRRKIQGNKL